jgi:hypothetical protein
LETATTTENDRDGVEKNNGGSKRAAALTSGNKLYGNLGCGATIGFSLPRQRYNRAPRPYPAAPILPANSTRLQPRMLPPDKPVLAPSRIVIEGMTLNGRVFRPSDWAERLCGIMSTFGTDRQMRYSRLVRPVMLDGVRCVVVEPSLQEIEPRAYRFLLDFAKDNALVILDPTAPVGEKYCPLPGGALEKLAI